MKQKQRSCERTSRKLREYPEGAIFRILILPLGLLNEEFKTWEVSLCMLEHTD